MQTKGLQAKKLIKMLKKKMMMNMEVNMNRL